MRCRTSRLALRPSTGRHEAIVVSRKRRRVGVTVDALDYADGRPASLRDFPDATAAFEPIADERVPIAVACHVPPFDPVVMHERDHFGPTQQPPDKPPLIAQRP